MNISAEKLFELYNDTLRKSGTYLLQENDAVIAYNIFEEFDIGVHSFFYLDSLKVLFDNGFISLEKLNKSKLLYENVAALQSAGEWNFDSFRKSEKWKEIMILCDEIRSLD